MLRDPFDVTDVELVIVADTADERWSRLQGLMAALSLPAVRCVDDGIYRKRVIEIEVVAGKWMPVDAVVIDDTCVLFSSGNNGSRAEYPFVGGIVPRWRFK